MKTRTAMWVAAMYAGSMGGLLSLVLIMRLNPDVVPTLKTLVVGVPLWLSWGALLVGVPLGVLAWPLSRIRPFRNWGVAEGASAMILFVLCLGSSLSWINAMLHPEFLSATVRRQLMQDAVTWAVTALLVIAGLRWWRRSGRRRWFASLALPLVVLLPVFRLAGAPTSVFLPLEVEAQALGRTNRPLLVCGIEGLDMNVLLEYGAGRTHPTFDRLTANGARGPMQPFKPFLDQALWTSLATGTLPREHGVMFHWGWLYPAAFDGTLRLLPWTPEGSRLFLAWDRGERVVPPPSTVPPLWQRMAFAQTPTTILDWPGIWDDSAGVRKVRKTVMPWASGPSLEASLGAILVGNYPRVASEVLSTLNDDVARVEQARLALEAGRTNVWLDLRLLEIVRRNLEPHRSGDTGRREAVALALELIDEQLGRLLETLPDDAVVVVVSPYGLAPPDSYERLRRLLGFGGTWRASAERCPPGLVMLSGRGVARGRQLAPMSPEDLAPTICYLLDLPVAQYMDGRVFFEAVESDYLATHPLHVVE